MTESQRKASALEVLKRLEWQEHPHEYRESEYFCPVCDKYKRQGHADGCALAAALAEPARASQDVCTEPVAHLWQHGETGRTRVVMPDSVTDCDASWQLIGPLYLPAPVREAEPAPVPLLTDEEIQTVANNLRWKSDFRTEFAIAIETLVRQKAGL